MGKASVVVLCAAFVCLVVDAQLSMTYVTQHQVEEDPARGSYVAALVVLCVVLVILVAVAIMLSVSNSRVFSQMEQERMKHIAPPQDDAFGEADSDEEEVEMHEK